MIRDDDLLLELLALRHSPEIHRLLPYLSAKERLGHLRFLQRIDRESREGIGSQAGGTRQ